MHFLKGPLFTEIEQKAFTQLPAVICCILSRNLLRACTFHRDRSINFHRCIFWEPTVSTEIEQKAFIQLCLDICCILSRNLLRTHTLHRDSITFLWGIFWEPAVSTDITESHQIQQTFQRHLLHFMKESAFSTEIEVSLSTDAFFESLHFLQRLNRKLSPDFPQTFVASYQGIFWEPALSTEI